MEVYRDIEQGTPEWYAIRAGLPTASEFHKVMAKVGPRGGTSHREYVMRTHYMRTLAYERIAGEPAEDGYSNFHMERGKEREAEARQLYAFMHDVAVEEVGFIRNGNCGCSPDGLVGAEGGVQIKDAVPHIQFARFEDAALPREYRWQVIGELLVSEREWWDFMSYCRGLKPFVVRTYRDTVKTELDELRDGIDRFCDELEVLVQRYRTW